MYTSCKVSPLDTRVLSIYMFFSNRNELRRNSIVAGDAIKKYNRSFSDRSYGFKWTVIGPMLVDAIFRSYALCTAITQQQVTRCIEMLNGWNKVHYFLTLILSPAIFVHGMQKKCSTHTLQRFGVSILLFIQVNVLHSSECFVHLFEEFEALAVAKPDAIQIMKKKMAQYIDNKTVTITNNST